MHCVFPSNRFNSPKNLQLCFINNSESEGEDDEGASSKEVGADSLDSNFAEFSKVVSQVMIYDAAKKH